MVFSDIIKTGMCGVLHRDEGMLGCDTMNTLKNVSALVCFRAAVLSVLIVQHDHLQKNHHTVTLMEA